MSLIFMRVLLLLLLIPLLVSKADSDTYCFNHEVKSTKSQCEEHHCFYDPYLERCFFSLEHARASFPCSNWSGNLTMNGYSNEEACMYHWCTGRVNKVDASFVCIDPPIDDTSGVTGWVDASVSTLAFLYDKLPVDLYFRYDTMPVLSAFDYLKIRPFDSSRIMIDYDDVFMVTALDPNVPENRSTFEIRPFINNYSYPIQSIYDTVASDRYYLVFTYIIRYRIDREDIPVAVLKQAINRPTRTAPNYWFQKHIAGFKFYIRQKNGLVKDYIGQVIADRWLDGKQHGDTEARLIRESMEEIVETIMKAICTVIVAAAALLVLFMLYDHYCPFPPLPARNQHPQEQVLHDTVEEEDEVDEDHIAFHTRSRMVNGELLELDSDSDDDDCDERKDDGLLTLE